MLLAMRLMLGVGESVMIPACSKILGFHLPEHHRGFANGVLQGAWSFGPAVGTLGAGLLTARYGWRPVFIGIGLTSLAWLPAWIKWMPGGGAMERSLVAALKSASSPPDSFRESQNLTRSEMHKVLDPKTQNVAERSELKVFTARGEARVLLVPCTYQYGACSTSSSL